MPVETDISCALAEPGAQSRSIETSISVSLVLREMVAWRDMIGSSQGGKLHPEIIS